MDFQSGANLDNRDVEAKEKDHMFEEIVATANAVDWKEKAKNQWRRFEDQDQDGSGSCVAQTIKKLAKVLGKLNNYDLNLSATSIYQRRSNKPDSGMIGIEAFDIWKNKGISLEGMVPSQKMSDSEMDTQIIKPEADQVAEVFKIGNHVGLNAGDFETVASVIQTTGKAVMVWFYFTGSEWSKEIPTIENPNLDRNNALRHSVPAVDFFLFGGKKYILVEDSAHFAGLTYHLISEEFFKARNWFARYPMNYKFNDQTQPQPPDETPSNKPKYTFNVDLQFGMRSADVVALQNILKFEGFFPVNIESTGYFGAITKSGVQKYQDKHNIAHASDGGYGRVGPKTRANLNTIYS